MSQNNKATTEVTTPKKHTKVQQFKFYGSLIISVIIIWGVIFGGLGAMTTSVLGVATMFQSLAVAIGTATPLTVLYLIHQHNNKK